MATQTLDAVRARMARRGVSQADIAVAGHMYPTAVSGIFRGLRYGRKRAEQFEKALKQLRLDRDDEDGENE